MNKSDLIVALAAKKNLTEKQATEIVDLVFDGFTDALKNGGRIEIRGFGSFHVQKYKAYKGRNPRTGSTIDVKPKKSPFFKVGKDLKKIVDGR
jgi:integration host factor subunit beta